MQALFYYLLVSFCVQSTHISYSPSLLSLLHYSTITIGCKLHNIIVGRREVYQITLWSTKQYHQRPAWSFFASFYYLCVSFCVQSTHITHSSSLLSLLHYSTTIIESKLHNIIFVRFCLFYMLLSLSNLI